jgi:O-antigen ligase
VILMCMIASIGFFLAIQDTTFRNLVETDVQTRIIRDERNDLFVSRRNEWHMAYSQWLETPLLGHGYGTTGGSAVIYEEDAGRWYGNTGELAVIDGSGYVGLLASDGLEGSQATATHWTAIRIPEPTGCGGRTTNCSRC